MKAILLVHIAATLVLAAANLSAMALAVVARRQRSPARILRMLRVHHVFAAKILVPAAAITLVTGAGLAYLRGASLAAPWLLGTLVLFVASALIGVLWLLPEEARAIAEASRQVGAREPTASARLVHHTAAPAVVLGEWSAQLTMVAMFILMIVRPG
jgi:uncharacterized membrane protein